jgi:hypothetical protein
MKRCDCIYAYGGLKYCNDSCKPSKKLIYTDDDNVSQPKQIQKDLTTPEEIAEELKKCRDNPFYFATVYVQIKNSEGKMMPFTTNLTEKQFNEIIENLKKEIPP